MRSKEGTDWSFLRTGPTPLCRERAQVEKLPLAVFQLPLHHRLRIGEQAAPAPCDHYLRALCYKDQIPTQSIGLTPHPQKQWAAFSLTLHCPLTVCFLQGQLLCGFSSGTDAWKCCVQQTPTVEMISCTVQCLQTAAVSIPFTDHGWSL